MDERSDMDKIEDVILPGFRFHPTDEELVDFYLKSKIQQRPLPIELIKQVDIYKFDPWDLPKLAGTGEKEWYFYCPRDRKYRNSARPNRVTGAGFWKATGTDRPIYSSDGKCIGLKKSLVFYRGRAAKGIKTDWMMHEFRLPSVSDSAPPKKVLDKSFPASDAWAICRIFKKTSSMAHRALSHSWVSQLPENMVSGMILNPGTNCSQFSSENISCTTEIGSVIQFCGQSDLHNASSTTFSTSDMPNYRPITSPLFKPSQFPVSNGDLSHDLTFFSPQEVSGPTRNQDPSMLFNTAFFCDGSKGCESVGFDGLNQQSSGLPSCLPQEIQENMGVEGNDQEGSRKSSEAFLVGSQGGIATRPFGFPFSLASEDHNAWKPILTWDSPPCPSDMSTSFSTNKCYT